MALHSWTSRGASPPSLTRLLLFDGSLLGCFPLSYWGTVEGREGSYEVQTGVSPPLGVEFDVGTRGRAYVVALFLGQHEIVLP